MSALLGASSFLIGAGVAALIANHYWHRYLRHLQREAEQLRIEQFHLLRMIAGLRSRRRTVEPPAWFPRESER